jgi:hypothetical protein
MLIRTPLCQGSCRSALLPARRAGAPHGVQVPFRADYPAAFRVLHITSQRPDLR